MTQTILESILSNLVENARQHGGEDVQVILSWRTSANANASASASASASDSNSNSDPSVELRVMDNGPGISQANAKRVFDRFFTTARDSGGSGLGLPIVRALAKAHDGEVTVQSTPGSTTFTVSLPAAHR